MDTAAIIDYGDNIDQMFVWTILKKLIFLRLFNSLKFIIVLD